MLSFLHSHNLFDCVHRYRNFLLFSLLRLWGLDEMNLILPLFLLGLDNTTFGLEHTLLMMPRLPLLTSLQSGDKLSC